LIVDVDHWPVWWQSVRGIATPRDAANSAVQPAQPHTAGAAQGLNRAFSTFAAWITVGRILLGRPLNLQVLKVSEQASCLFEMHVSGDLHGRATWLFAPVAASVVPTVGNAVPSTDVTCRWEMASPVLLLPQIGWLGMLLRLLVERHHFSRMRACARDMGRALGCAASAQGEWSGAWRH
jgi:hypothetical protein